MLTAAVNQMGWTSNPASISKLSRWTFAIQAIIDSYAFVAVRQAVQPCGFQTHIAQHLTIGIVSNNRSSGSLIAPGFLAASLCLVFEVVRTIRVTQCSRHNNMSAALRYINAQDPGPRRCCCASTTAAAPSDAFGLGSCCSPPSCSGQSSQRPRISAIRLYHLSSRSTGRWASCKSISGRTIYMEGCGGVC